MSSDLVGRGMWIRRVAAESSTSIKAMSDDDTVWQSYGPGEAPDWLRPSRRQRMWVRWRVTLHRSLGIPPPSYVAHNLMPIGARRIFRRIRGLS